MLFRAGLSVCVFNLHSGSWCPGHVLGPPVGELALLLLDAPGFGPVPFWLTAVLVDGSPGQGVRLRGLSRALRLHICKPFVLKVLMNLSVLPCGFGGALIPCSPPCPVGDTCSFSVALLSLRREYPLGQVASSFTYPEGL